MIRISEQYFWGFVFSVFFVVLMVLAAIILRTEAYVTWQDLTTFDYVVMTLATWRLTRLMIADSVTRWFREQFMDVVKAGRGYRLETPKRGPRKLLAELVSCPWCMSVWTGALVLFVYLLTPYAMYPCAVLALSAVVAFLYNLSQLVGNAAERAKKQSELL